MSFNNHLCISKPSLIDLNGEELHYCPLIFNLDRFGGSSNASEYVFCRICVSNKTEDANLKVFIMIIGITGFKTLIKLNSFVCRYLIVQNGIQNKNSNK